MGNFCFSKIFEKIRLNVRFANKMGNFVKIFGEFYANDCVVGVAVSEKERFVATKKKI